LLGNCWSATARTRVVRRSPSARPPGGRSSLRHPRSA